MGIHDGHRDRLRNKVRNYGFECLEEHEKLEYLLYPFIPRRDTNPIAHELIETFGSYRKVLDADPEVLSSVKGMTENAALYLHTLPDAFSAYLAAEKDGKYDTSAKCAALVVGRIGRKTTEHLFVGYLEEDGSLIKSDVRSSAEKRSVKVDREALVSDAVRCRAKYVVIGHNHPNGDLHPSPEDVDSTNRIAQALALVGVTLVDSVIASGYEYYSLKDHGDLVAAVSMNGSIGQFAQDLVRREKDVDRIKVSLERSRK